MPKPRIPHQKLDQADLLLEKLLFGKLCDMPPSNNSTQGCSIDDSKDCCYYIEAKDQKSFVSPIEAATESLSPAEEYHALSDGRVFKVIRIKRNQARLQLSQIKRGIYISNMIEDKNSPSGLKIGMRIIAINNNPCPLTVELAAEMMQVKEESKSLEDNEYLTLVVSDRNEHVGNKKSRIL